MVPYERIVQWTAGPIAIVAGWLATLLTSHLSFLGKGVSGHSQVAHAIVGGLTFVVGAGVTYAAHHKWLDNLTKWWEQPNTQMVAGEVGQLAPGLLTTGADGFVMPDPAAVEGEIAHLDAALTKLLADPGTPPNEVVAGLAPTPPVAT